MPIRFLTDPKEIAEFDRKHPFVPTIVFGPRQTSASKTQSKTGSPQEKKDKDAPKKQRANGLAQ